MRFFAERDYRSKEAMEILKKYIFFDLDGTLTDPALGITNSIMYALEQFGIRTKRREELYKFIGPPLLDSFMEAYGFSRERAEEALKNYRIYFEQTGIFENRIYDNIPELLSSLQTAGARLVLATSKPEIFARRILDHFNLATYFYRIGGADMAGVRVTKKAVIGYMLAGLDDAVSANCIMVGDRKYDVVGAASFQIDTVGVSYGYGSRDELTRAGAKYIADSVSELKEILFHLDKC